MATHSSILAWKTQGQRSLMGSSPQGHKRVRNDLATKQLILKDVTLKVCFTKKGLNELGNHNGLVTHLEPDILNVNSNGP